MELYTTNPPFHLHIVIHYARRFRQLEFLNMYFLQPYWEQVKSTGHLMVDLYVGCLVIGFHIFLVQITIRIRFAMQLCTFY